MAYIDYAVVLIVWGAWEFFVSWKKRDRSHSASPTAPQSLMILWGVGVGSIAVSIIVALLGVHPSMTYEGFRLIGFAVLFIGMAIRGHAIYTLGRFFSVHVEMHADHKLIQSGLYQYVRHPSYTGLLVSFIGLGIALGNWLSLALLVIPIAVALAYRIEVEEKALTEEFGDAYTAYCVQAKRLIPWIY